MNEVRNWIKLITVIALLNFIYRLSSFIGMYSQVRIILYSIAIVLTIVLFVIRNKSVINNDISNLDYKKIVFKYMALIIIPLAIIINVVYLLMLNTLFNSKYELHNFLQILNTTVLINFVIIAVIAMLYNLSTNEETKLSVLLKIVGSVLVATIVKVLLSRIITIPLYSWAVATSTTSSFKYYLVVNMFVMTALLTIKLILVALLCKRSINWTSEDNMAVIYSESNGNDLFDAR